jgi:hypothetical protein
MSRGVRKFVLAAHLSSSMGWMGAVCAYLALDVVTAVSADVAALRAAYRGMSLIVCYVVVPLAIGALLTGLAMALGTRWGLFRHWWVVISLLATLASTGVLLVEAMTVNRLAAIAADATSSPDDLRRLGSTLLHSVGGLLVLLVVAWLNVYKPSGLTPYGWRKLQEESQVARGGDNAA